MVWLNLCKKCVGELGTSHSVGVLDVGQWHLTISPFLGGLRHTKVHPSTTTQKYCWRELLHAFAGLSYNLIYNGNCVRLQTGHFPALPHCDNLKASQPLYWESLTAIENNKENKRGQISEFPLAMRDQSAVQHTFCGAGCPKKRSLDS